MWFQLPEWKLFSLQSRICKSRSSEQKTHEEEVAALKETVQSQPSAANISFFQQNQPWGRGQYRTRFQVPYGQSNFLMGRCCQQSGQRGYR